MDLRQTPRSIIPVHNMTFLAELERIAWTVEQRLGEFLAAGETAPPGGTELGEAMRYAALGGGKRLQPFLLIQSARLFGVDERHSLDAACARMHCDTARSSMTTCQPWMTTPSAAAVQLFVSPSTGEAAILPAIPADLAFEIASAPTTEDTA
ncbi:MAG: hypothetical protein R3D30_01025 [Hyphomicrobiales bacterium]